MSGLNQFLTKDATSFINKEFIKDIFRVEASFAAWGEEFTSDCTEKDSTALLLKHETVSDVKNNGPEETLSSTVTFDLSHVNRYFQTNRCSFTEIDYCVDAPQS